MNLKCLNNSVFRLLLSSDKIKRNVDLKSIFLILKKSTLGFSECIHETELILSIIDKSSDFTCSKNDISNTSKK